MPAHVRAHLAEIGALNHDGIGRTARLGRCRSCSAEVMRGLDGPVAARPAVVDAIEVDQLGEALAVATARSRWWLGRFSDGKRGSSWQLVPRWLDDLGKPPRGPVFVEHKCGAPPPPASTTRFPFHASQSYDSIDPPF